MLIESSKIHEKKNINETTGAAEHNGVQPKTASLQLSFFFPFTKRAPRDTYSAGRRRSPDSCESGTTVIIQLVPRCITRIEIEGQPQAEVMMADSSLFGFVRRFGELAA
ncbi:hypothetical protein Adt_29281 [Abeliophyllum distichum]|uniref:Uncharacterized protein n=1 Tax=Abeliophyllum distichum TaxID=126358 RepID=A0ABD1R7X9_9LAMI